MKRSNIATRIARTIALAAAVIVGVSLAAPGAARADWYNAQVTSPGSGATIVDTGAFGSGGQYPVTVWVHSTLTGSFDFQLVDTNGTTVLKRQRFTVLGGSADASISPAVAISISSGQSLRVVSVSALTFGVVTASILTP